MISLQSIFLFLLLSAAAIPCALCTALSNYTKLFSASDWIISGPTVFPKPTDFAGSDILPILTPTIGKHRPHVDAVFVFAIEYELTTYLTFVSSLRKTGFQGDIVFAISELDYKDAEVKDFLTYATGVVTYVVTLSCFNSELQRVESAKGGMRVCQIHSLLGRKTTTTQGLEVAPIQDPRKPRTIAILRYELFWIWSLKYIPHTWIMILDGRDTYFQKNPFESVPRTAIKDANTQDGLLYFFGENVDATRLGTSIKNRAWLQHAYGDTVVKALEDKPTICSGVSMGEQVAIEAYIRAMVAEADETGTVMMGADQGFHNYLFHTNKLANSKNIRSITIFDQGWGLVNNMGALRTKDLNQWGNGKILNHVDEHTISVLNWDGLPSPVVHQFDRHKELSKYVHKILADEFKSKYLEEHNTRLQAAAAQAAAEQAAAEKAAADKAAADKAAADQAAAAQVTPEQAAAAQATPEQAAADKAAADKAAADKAAADQAAADKAAADTAAAAQATPDQAAADKAAADKAAADQAAADKAAADKAAADKAAADQAAAAQATPDQAAADKAAADKAAADKAAADQAAADKAAADKAAADKAAADQAAAAQATPDQAAADKAAADKAAADKAAADKAAADKAAADKAAADQAAAAQATPDQVAADKAAADKAAADKAAADQAAAAQAAVVA